MSIANSNASSEESFGTKFGKELTFSQPYDFLKLHKEYIFNTYHTHHVYVKYVKILLGKGLNNRKRIFREKFPTNPHDLVEKLSCNSDEGDSILERCSLCKSPETIDDMKLDCSSDTDSSSETVSSSENTYSSSEENSDNMFYR